MFHFAHNACAKKVALWAVVLVAPLVHLPVCHGTNTLANLTVDNVLKDHNSIYFQCDPCHPAQLKNGENQFCQSNTGNICEMEPCDENNPIVGVSNWWCQRNTATPIFSPDDNKRYWGERYKIWQDAHPNEYPIRNLQDVTLTNVPLVKMISAARTGSPRYALWNDRAYKCAPCNTRIWKTNPHDWCYWEQMPIDKAWYPQPQVQPISGHHLPDIPAKCPNHTARCDYNIKLCKKPQPCDKVVGGEPLLWGRGWLCDPDNDQGSVAVGPDGVPLFHYPSLLPHVNQQTITDSENRKLEVTTWTGKLGYENLGSVLPYESTCHESAFCSFITSSLFQFILLAVTIALPSGAALFSYLADDIEIGGAVTFEEEVNGESVDKSDYSDLDDQVPRNRRNAFCGMEQFLKQVLDDNPNPLSEGLLKLTQRTLPTTKGARGRRLTRSGSLQNSSTDKVVKGCFIMSFGGGGAGGCSWPEAGLRL